MLLAPAAWAGERQRWWSYAILSLLAAGSLALMVGWAVVAGATGGVALLAGAACVLGPPALFYGQQAFPELPQALLLAVPAVLLLRPTAAAVLAVALCLAAAPWFTDRALPPAFFLGLSALLAAPGRRLKALLLALFLADLAGLAVYYHHHLGVPWPRNTHTVLKAPLGYMPMGFLQLFFSSLHGLFFFFPLLAALPVAAWGLTYGAIVAGRSRWWFAKFHPIFNLDTHSPLFAWLPDLAQPTPRAYALCAAWGLVALGLAWLLARASRPMRPAVPPA